GRGVDELRAIAPLVQERVRHLDEVAEYVDFLVEAPTDFDEAAWAKHLERFEPAAAILDDAIAAYADCDWTADSLHAVTAEIAYRHGTRRGKATGPIRVAVTGRGVGPPLFESLEVLGRQATVERMKVVRDRL